MKILLTLLILASLVFAKSTIAVKSLKTDLLSAQDAESVTNFITNELSNMAVNDKVMAWSDLEEMLKQLGQASEMAALASDAEELECLTDKCFQELGGALGVEKILVTDIAKIGSFMIVNMRVIDLLTASSNARSSLKVKNGIDGVIEGIPGLLQGLGYANVVDITIQNNQKEAERKRLNDEKLAKEKAEKERQAQARLAEEKKKKDAEARKQQLKHEAAEKLRKEEAAKEAAREAALDKDDTNRKMRALTRYGGLGLSVVGGALAYLAEQSAANANKNAEVALASNSIDAYNAALSESRSAGTNRNIGFGLLGFGLVSVGVSFAF